MFLRRYFTIIWKSFFNWIKKRKLQGEKRKSTKILFSILYDFFVDIFSALLFQHFQILNETVLLKWTLFWSFSDCLKTSYKNIPLQTKKKNLSRKRMRSEKRNTKFGSAFLLLLLFACVFPLNTLVFVWSVRPKNSFDRNRARATEYRLKE